MEANRCIVFAGDAERGNRIQDAVKANAWRLIRAEGPEQAMALCARHGPDLVIIDDFPRSAAARSVFYALRAAGKGPFLMLTDRPEDLRFSRLGGLSFIHMLGRDPAPADLESALCRLIEASRGTRSRRTGRPWRAKPGPRRGIHPQPAGTQPGGACVKLRSDVWMEST